MRTTALALLLPFALLGAALAAQFEISADFMQTIEDTTRSLDSNVALKDAASAGKEAQELAQAFAEVEAFYQQRGDAADGVRLAQQGRVSAETIAQAVASNDFAAASHAVSTLTRTCKGCHELYKN